MDMYTATEVADRDSYKKGFRDGYKKGFTDGVIAMLNKFQEPINMTQVWELMSKLAEDCNLEKVNGIYRLKER